MENITVPPIYVPLNTGINPYVETAHTHTVQWACDMGLVEPDGRLHKRLQAAKFAWLTALTQPYSELDDLNLAADWHTWLFAHDDVFDDSIVGQDPDQVLAIDHRLIDILRGDKLTSDDGALAFALCDIRNRVIARTNDYWATRFVDSVELYFQANAWEATNRLQGRTPDLTTYIKLRLYTGAVYTCFNIINLSEDFNPNSRFLQHVYTQQLAQMANHHICWVNDILGLHKEIKEKNMNNLVLVLKHAHKISLQEAVNQSVALCNKEMKAFMELEGRLPSFGDVEDMQLRRYVTTLIAWMCGHVTWYTETGRYQVVAESVQNGMAY